MKNILLVVLMLTASYAWAYDGFVIMDSGDTLFFNVNINTGKAEITYPGTNFNYPWEGHTKPSGILVIPDSITYNNIKYPVASIDTSTFRQCQELTSLIIPSSCRTIEYRAFYFCTGLTSVVISDSVNIIGEEAFEGCTHLSNLTLGNSITTIEEYSFFACDSLTSITIPAGVQTIGNYAFADCGYPMVVNMLPSTPPLRSNHSFYDCVSVFNIPCGTIGDYADNGYGMCSEYGYITAINLQEPEVEITMTVETNDSSMGVGRVIMRNGVSVTCDSASIIEAIPESYYHFVQWSNGNTANPDTLHLEGDSIVTAFFAPDRYALLDVMTIEINDSTLGSITFLCEDTVAYRDTIVVVAYPNSHYHINWELGNVLSGLYRDGRCDISPNKNTLKAVLLGQDYYARCNFTIDTHIVNVASSDIARGRVEGGGLFEYGTPCTISAEAYSGYHFSHWSNGATYNPYTFAVLEDTELTAVFLAEGEVGIGDINANDINVYSFGGRIVVVETTDEVRVFDMTGRSVRNEALPAGVYMVKIGERPARKVVVMR